jgi:hypothetical protein
MLLQQFHTQDCALHHGDAQICTHHMCAIRCPFGLRECYVVKDVMVVPDASVKNNHRTQIKHR